ncbi:unnamed protein product [Caenorhabditis sp. 36 PRJEB53466]|nr:unnamed protein product [Caenorhabditis sp. 36 PRJEB53466]
MPKPTPPVIKAPIRVEPAPARLLGTPLFRETDIDLWNLTAAQCSGCLTVVPHSQLFVCVRDTCQYIIRQSRPINTPTEFYNQEKVFCGNCSFRGIHSRHAKFMEPAEPLAIKCASSEFGTKLEETYHSMAFIDANEPVDYLMAKEFATQKLPLLPVADYLASSTNVCEWTKKKAMLEEVAKVFQESRRDGYEFVKSLARKALDAYQNAVKAIEEELTQKPFELEQMEARKRAHYERMGDPPRECRSSSQSIRTATVSSQLPELVVPKNEDPDSFAESIATIVKHEESRENDESIVKMLCSTLTQRFDTIRDDLKLEEALRVVTDMLHEKTGDLKHKLAAAQMFKEKTTFSLNYEPRE